MSGECFDTLTDVTESQGRRPKARSNTETPPEAVGQTLAAECSPVSTCHDWKTEKGTDVLAFSRRQSNNARLAAEGTLRRPGTGRQLDTGSPDGNLVGYPRDRFTLST